MTDLILTSLDNIQRILDEYAAWAEERELDGRDSSVDAYKVHLRAQRQIEALEDIRGISGDMSTFSGPVEEIMERFVFINTIATNALKEAVE